MKLSSIVIAALALTAAFAFLFVYALLDIDDIRLYLISMHPETKHIVKLEQVIFVLSSAGLLVLVQMVLLINTSARKPRVIKEYVELDGGSKASVDNAEQNESAKEQKQISEKAKKILEGLDNSDMKTLGESFLIALSKNYDIVQGIFYIKDIKSDNFSLAASYAYYSTEDNVRSFKYGHGLPGQVAMNKELLNLKNVPQKYLTIMSGLGDSSPKHLMIFPLVINGETVAVVELASFSYFDAQTEKVLKQCASSLSDSFAEIVGLKPDTTEA